MTEDDQHLRLLSIFHSIVAAMIGLLSLLPLIHLGLGLAMVTGHLGQPGGDAPDRMVGWFFVVAASCVILAGLSIATCVALGGRFLALRRRYTFCLVAAGLACVFTPLGTVLGVFTIVVLMRDSVRAAFGRPPYAAAGPAPGSTA